MAEYESHLTSERTRDAMEAAKKRGVRFGAPTWCFSPDTRRKAAERARTSHVSRALDAYADIAPIAVTLREAVDEHGPRSPDSLTLKATRRVPGELGRSRAFAASLNASERESHKRRALR